MELLIPKFVRTPFLTPLPAENMAPPCNSLEPADTLKTLFICYESPFLVNVKELFQMFENLKRNIPSIVNLQSEVLEQGPPPNAHSNCISLWEHILTDPKYHLFSLNPIPSFDDLKLSALINLCKDYKVAPDRAAWAIHKYVIAKDISQKALTKELKSNPAYYVKDMDYFSKFGFALYTRNLVQHSKFLTWMIDIMKPENLIIFTKEILKTHSILSYALKSKEGAKYVNFFQNDLVLNKSQLIQFSVINQIKKNAKNFDLMPLLSNDMKHRARKICRLTLADLAFSTTLGNLLFTYFPNFDSDIFTAEIREMIHFSDSDELREDILSMCKSVLWFNQHLVSISSIIAHLINVLINDFKPLDFPLDGFIDLLYNNSNSIKHFVFLFSELQEYAMFDYMNFMKRIFNRGLLYSKKEETKEIILSLPCTSKVKETLRKLANFVDRVLPNNTIQTDLPKILSDPKNTEDIMAKLPFVMRYQLAMYYIKKMDDYPFSHTAKMIARLGAPNLIISLFKDFKDKDKIIWTMELVPIIKEIIPSFIAKKIFEPLVYSIFRDISNPANLELALFLDDNYKTYSTVSKYKDLLKEMKNAKSSSPDCLKVDKEAILNLFTEHSYMCSLHVFDSFFSVKTVKDFLAVFPLFINDLFSFESIDSEDLYKFFLEFSESSAITRASNVFVRNLLNFFIQSTGDLTENERVISILQEFFAKVLRSKVVDVTLFLETIFSLCKKTKGKTTPPQAAYALIQRILLKILEDDPESFPVEKILTENIVKGFTQSFPQENTPFIGLLQILRSFPPPIITEEIFALIDSGSTAGMTYAAALFSLLPTSMQSPNFVDVFDYFKANVKRSTLTFWTLWLKWKPNFNPGVPVSIAQPDKEAISTYRATLISAFSSLLFHSQPGDEKTRVYLNSWFLLCKNPVFSKAIVDSSINDLHAMKLSLCPMTITILRPSLMYISDKTFEQLCDGLLKYTYDETQFEQFTKLASSVFAVFVYRFPTNQTVVPLIADKVLEWVPAIYKMHKELEFVIDVFNFVMCFSNDENPQRKKENNALQEKIHTKIKANLEKISDEISGLILLNLPPQIYRPSKDPLYADFTMPTEPEQPNNYQPANTYSPDHNDSGFSNQFDSAIFQPFDDDFQTWF